MKWIKLFESFIGTNPVEVYEDIKSITYELEDIGYDLEFFYILNIDKTHTNYKEDQLGYNHAKRIRCDSYDKSEYPRHNIVEIVIDSKMTTVYTPGANRVISDDRDKFISLLKEHLDYIDTSGIRIATLGVRRFKIAIPV